MKPRTTLAAIVILAMLTFLTANCAFAQVGASSAQLNGTVRDESGGSVAKANADPARNGDESHLHRRVQ